MNRLTLFDGASIKSKELSNWAADDWFSVFGSYFGTDGDSPRSLYSLVGWLYACVNLRADRISAMPWAIFRGEEKLLSDIDDLSGYPFLDNLTDLLELTEGALCLGGYAYWFKARNARNQPLGLRWFAPDTMMPLYDPQIGIAGFRRMAQGTAAGFVGSAANIIYSPDDIVYFRLPNSFSELEPGTPPAQAALADAQVLHHMSEFTAAFFARGAIKATVLAIDPDTQDDQMAKIEAWWKRFFSGVKKAWSTAAIRGKLEAVVVGEGLESLTNSELTTERRQSIATALGVPHSIVAADAANFATAQQDEINFLNNCIIPESRLIERTMNRQMFAATGLRFHFEPQRLSAMQEDEEERARSYAFYVGTSMKPSIAAQLVGLDLPDGITYEMLDEDLLEQQRMLQAQADAQMAHIPKAEHSPATLAEQSSVESQGKRLEDVRRLKRWAKGKKSPDVDRFDSDLLSREEKLMALGVAETKGDAGAEDAPFPATYP